MKKYKKVELVAKNQVAGSYAAGCPTKNRGKQCAIFANHGEDGCSVCERSQ